MSNTYAKPELWDSHALVTDDGKELKKGAVVKDHRGDKHKVVGFQIPHHSGSSGRVFTKHGSKYQYDGQFFPSVVGAKIKERKFSSAGEHTGYHKGFGEEVEINEISSKLAKSYLKKTAPGSEDSNKIDSAIDAQMKGGKNAKDSQKLAMKGFNRLIGRMSAKDRVGIRGKIRSWSNVKEEAELNERDRSEYQANAQLQGKSSGKPGHYLVKDGRKISGPHDSMDNAYSEYRKLDDVRGVKIQHMREEIDVQGATEKKVKAAAEKAITLAKKKKGNQTANTKPELPMPNTQMSQPALMGSEQESESKGA